MSTHYSWVFLPPKKWVVASNCHLTMIAVVAYPRQLCLIYRFCSSVPDFAVSLPSLLLSTSLRLANASGTTPCMRDLHPLEKYTSLEQCLTKIICNFEILLSLSAGARCSCRTHTFCISNDKERAKYQGL